MKKETVLFAALIVASVSLVIFGVVFEITKFLAFVKFLFS